MPADLAQPDIDAAVYQQTLDRFADAFWTKDKEVMRNFFSFPFCFGLKTTEKTFTDVDALLKLFLGWRSALETIQTDLFHCTCRKATFIPGQQPQLTGVHDTYVISNNSFLRDPFLCSMTLIQDGQQMYLREWRIFLKGREFPTPCQVCFEEAGLDLDA